MLKSRMKSGFSITLPTLVLSIILIAILLIFAYSRLFYGIAKVNGKRITRVHYINELEKLFGKQTIEMLITKELVYQEAKKKNVTVTQKEIDDEIIKIEKNLKMQGKTVNQVLTVQGISRKDYEDQIRIQKTAEKLVMKDIVVTNQEVNVFISNNRSRYGNKIITQKIREEIIAQIRKQKFNQYLRVWLANIRKNATVEILSR